MSRTAKKWSQSSLPRVSLWSPFSFPRSSLVYTRVVYETYPWITCSRLPLNLGIPQSRQGRVTLILPIVDDTTRVYTLTRRGSHSSREGPPFSFPRSSLVYTRVVHQTDSWITMTRLPLNLGIPQSRQGRVTLILPIVDDTTRVYNPDKKGVALFKKRDALTQIQEVVVALLGHLTR